MKRLVTLSALVAFGSFAASSGWAKSGSSHGSSHSSSMHNSSQHVSSNHSMSDYCKDHCDKNYCDKDHCGKDYCKDHNGNPYGNMGGSTTGPVGTPENPNPVKFPINTIHPIVNNNPTTVSSNGFVWAGDHWERPRAGQSYTLDPNLTGPVVRNHPNGAGEGGVTVTNVGGFNGKVTDHRGFNGKVTDHRGDGQIQDIGTGWGGFTGAISSGLDSIGSALGGLFTTTVGDPGRPQVVDHRTNPTSNFGSNVTDHRHN